MGIVDRFRRPRKQIVDPVFGKLTLERGTWIGRVKLPGATDDVEVGIDADETGPGEHTVPLCRSSCRGTPACWPPCWPAW